VQSTPANVPALFKVPEQCPMLPPVTSGPMPGHAREPHQAGFDGK
jgi:hypothetical protein